ncbi:MAG: rhodanese-like domain-containing protein [Bacteroidota bacterium]
MKNIIIFCIYILAINQIHAQTVLEIDSHRAFEILEHFNYHSGVLIDGRDSTMFASGHIEKAIQINAYEENLGEKLTPYLTREKIMVYCTTHRRTNTIIDKLKELDYQGEIIVVMDGITGWKENNLPLEQ